MSKIKSPEEFNSLIEVATYFNSEALCLQYLEQTLWDGNIRCPHCGMDVVYRFKDGKRFKCKICKEYFSAKIGTIFEGTKLPLQKWFMAMYLLASHKKGVSSCQLARDIGVTQKTAWFMSHRIRKALRQIHDEKMEGVLEVDESFVGGKNKNRHKDKKFKYGYDIGRDYRDKTPIVGIIKRNGEVRTVVVTDTSKQTIAPLIKEHVKVGSTIYSDDWHAYTYLREQYKHEVVEHARGQYRNGDACTNSIESFWSHLKRMIIGVYHHVSQKHLQKYADELTFRFNNRHLKQGERLKLLFTRVNCTLKYKKLISGYE